jgi:negative regulator of sigma E activity
MMPAQLSRLIDADLESPDLSAALQTLGRDAGAREAVTVYQIIGDALRGRPVLDDGYSHRIFAALDGVTIDPA